MTVDKAKGNVRGGLAHTHTALERQFSTALGREIDLLTEASLSPYLREHTLGDLQILYGVR